MHRSVRGSVTVAAGENAEYVFGLRVTATLFGTLGVQPAPGRGFTIDEQTQMRRR